MPQEFACFGLSVLGRCLYNPAQPSPTYFTLGDAIAALGFTLAIQQLLKPIYVFRLRASRLKLRHLSIAVFLGALSALVATLLPNLPLAHEGLLEYPITWEVLAAFVIALAYGVAAFVSLNPVCLYEFNIIPFVRAAADLLSSASDEDRASFATDLFQGNNLERLIKFTLAFDKARVREAYLEIEHLRSIGAPPQLAGRAPADPFYRFTYRKELSRAWFANKLLQILSDPDFCSVLVIKCPWITARALQSLSRKRIRAECAKTFVQHIAYQAIQIDEGMMAKETAYIGFGATPILSESLFKDWFILSHYDPLSGFGLSGPEIPSKGYVDRLNSAAKMMLTVAIQEQDYWDAVYIHSLRRSYEDLCRRLGHGKTRSLTADQSASLSLGLQKLCKTLRTGLEALPWERRRSLFKSDRKDCLPTVVADVAVIISESLSCFANDFDGPSDQSWSFVTHVLFALYLFDDRARLGMDPLQQCVATCLLEGLKRNMRGGYPAISRILLAVIGPYAGKFQIHPGSAWALLTDAVYRELGSLPILHAKNPGNTEKFLPLSVTYDAATNTLTHTDLSGASAVTNLSTLVIPDIDLFSPRSWHGAPDLSPAPATPES